jgi:hypothetical protein
MIGRCAFLGPLSNDDADRSLARVAGNHCDCLLVFGAWHHAASYGSLRADRTHGCVCDRGSADGLRVRQRALLANCCGTCTNHSGRFARSGAAPGTWEKGGLVGFRRKRKRDCDRHCVGVAAETNVRRPFSRACLRGPASHYPQQFRSAGAWQPACSTRSVLRCRRRSHSDAI